jgi:hypothetical protein
MAVDRDTGRLDLRGGKFTPGKSLDSAIAEREEVSSLGVSGVAALLDFPVLGTCWL